MKKLKKISLLDLNQVELEKKQQQLIFGGGTSCKCGSCSSSTSHSSNLNANYKKGITETGTNSPECKCTGNIETISGWW